MQNCYPRFNAGRPTLPVSRRTVRVAGSVLPADKAWLIEIGDGNFSQGLRKAIAVAKQNLSPELIAAELAALHAYVADAPRRKAEDDAIQDAALAGFAAADVAGTVFPNAESFD